MRQPTHSRNDGHPNGSRCSPPGGRRHTRYGCIIAVLQLTTEAYERWVRSPLIDTEITEVDVVVVHGSTDDLTSPESLPIIVIWCGDQFGGSGPAGCDLVVGHHDVDEALDTIAMHPQAARSLAVLLRGQPGRSVSDGLAAESAVYSTLQAGGEFARWRAANPPALPTDESEPVVVRRDGDVLTICLNRPHRHNAINAGLRDRLCDALTLAIADDDIRRVELRGNGPSFSSGGDLDEFGSRRDPASAHLIRLTRSPARLIHRLRDRTTAFVHGATFGGGIETAAFAHRVVADPSTSFALPEIGLGLIPGAGGTVSMTRRIGRQRTAALALTGRRINTDVALAWGLIDQIAQP